MVKRSNAMAEETSKLARGTSRAHYGGLRLFFVLAVIMSVFYYFCGAQAMGGEKTMETSRNFQINGSFEYTTNPDIPDYWAGTGNNFYSWGLPVDMCTEKGISEFREKFLLDKTTALHGNNSLRVQAPFHVMSMGMAVATGQDYTVSVYLKSDVSALKARIGATERDAGKLLLSNEVTAGPAWQRFEFVLREYPHNSMSVFIQPVDPGKLWVDAIQIEPGNKATPFKPCWYDVGFTQPQTPIHGQPETTKINPVVELKSPLAVPPKLDGILDERLWEKAPMVSMNDYLGAPATTETTVKICHDSENIYLGFECSDPGQAEGRGDSIEIFIDLLGLGEPFYQFVFDAGGKKSNYRHSVSGLHDWGWQADWQVATKMGRDRWTAEVAIPLATMPDYKELAGVQSLRMNFCRNYPAGNEKYLCWAPVQVGFLEPESFGTVAFGAGNAQKFNYQVAAPVMKCADAAEDIFSLSFSIANQTEKEEKIYAIACLERNDQVPQLKTRKIALSANAPTTVEFSGFTIKELFCRVDLMLINENGEKLKHLRRLMDVPRPMRVYSEYSFYTTEKEARVVVDFNCNAEYLDNKSLLLATKLPGQKELNKKTFVPEKKSGRQMFSIPVDKLPPGHTYVVEAQLVEVGKEKEILMKAESDLVKYRPHKVEVKINRINRGIYLNGEPYLPYGILISIFENEQLQYYRNCGFDYVCFVSHWRGVEKNLEFLANCEKIGLNAIAFHVSRPGSISPDEAARQYRSCPSLIGIVPNDEEASLDVYRVVTQVKNVYPEILNCGNHNFVSYQAFGNRLRGFPGDVLSIDRYPLLTLPKGRPQTISEIYSVERCIEIMDRDGKRERLPLFFWLQAGERFSKEPTVVELTWMNYILLVNHCVGFTYFSTIPHSRYVWERMQSLNREIQSLKPALFTLEEEPPIVLADERTRNYIRVLPKKLDDTVTLICVNRIVEEVIASLDLGPAGVAGGTEVEVLFEGRKIKVGDDGILRDGFAPLARHVYEIKLPEKKRASVIEKKES